MLMHRLDWGDMVSVTVVNKLQNNGTGVHYHGIRQLNSNTEDGVGGITECVPTVHMFLLLADQQLLILKGPIAPGSSRTYTWHATQFGTTWYHSHFSVQYGEGLWGPLVINGEHSLLT